MLEAGTGHLVHYSDYAGWATKESIYYWQGQDIFLFSASSRSALGSECTSDILMAWCLIEYTLSFLKHAWY
jgi:hypothetical protein